jgi:hypothetical protein
VIAPMLGRSLYLRRGGGNSNQLLPLRLVRSGEDGLGMILLVWSSARYLGLVPHVVALLLVLR